MDLKQLAIDANVPYSKAQEAYVEAINISREDYGKEDDFMIETITKRILGLKESNNFIEQYLNCDLSLKEFIDSKLKEDEEIEVEKTDKEEPKKEDAQVSTSLGNISTADHEIHPSKDLKVSEEDDNIQEVDETYNSEEFPGSEGKEHLLDNPENKEVDEAIDGNVMAISDVPYYINNDHIEVPNK